MCVLIVIIVGKDNILVYENVEFVVWLDLDGGLNI